MRIYEVVFTLKGAMVQKLMVNAYSPGHARNVAQARKLTVAWDDVEATAVGG